MAKCRYENQTIIDKIDVQQERKKMGRAYKLYGSNTAAINAMASLRVTKNCRIRCVLFSSAGVAGAATTGIQTLELSKQNVISNAVNDTPETVIATVLVPYPISGGVGSVNVSFLCDLPCSVGDTLYVNLGLSGLVPASSTHQITIFTD